MSTLNDLGRRQVVRHQTLDLAFEGSNPSAPAKHKLKNRVEYHYQMTVISKSENKVFETIGIRDVRSTQNF